MKKIRLLVVMLLLLFSLGFASNVMAETTEEVATEEQATTVLEEDNFQLPDLSDSAEQVKAWIAGILMSLVSGGLLSFVGYLILTKLKSKALDEVHKAVDTNAISQKQADQAVNLINQATQKIDVKLKEFEDRVESKLDEASGKMDVISGKMSKIDDAVNNFIKAIDKYLNDDVEE